MRPSLRAFLFCFPLAALFGPPALVLWLGGELMAPERVVAKQSARDHLVLHGAAYTNATTYVKMHVLVQRAPEVLALGSSRVMQFRAGFFLNPGAFYNLGGTVARIMHFRGVLERIPPASLPRVLLISTDAYFFQPGFDKLERDQLNVAWLHDQMDAHQTGSEVFFADWWTVWRDLFSGKIAWRALVSVRGLSDRIGLNAVCRGQGFRNDGSYLYGSLDRDISNPQHRDFRFAQTLGYIAAGSGRFVYGQKISDGALRELIALLDWCGAHGIEVVAFLPPYPHEVWSQMEAKGDKYAYLWKLPATLRPIFEERNFEFHDFSDFAWLGAPDSEAVDGFHGSERTYLRLVIAMLKRGSLLNRDASLPDLERELAAAKTWTNVVPDTF